MYDIRQFKPTLYLLVLMGLTGFAMAANEPGLWGLAVSALAINAWMVRSGRFVPIPRWLANGITLVAMFYVIGQVRRATDTPILLIGQFLVLLQLVKLYEQRANRDYFQLLVLTMLLMVAASINTASLLFGMLLLVYLFMALYCCLLLHLKSETDRARSAQTLGPEKLSAATLRQDQRHLPHSMRRLTWIVAGASLATATVVFLGFPRGTGAGLFGQLQLRPAEATVGFSDHINFSDVAPIGQSSRLVARVKLWNNHQLVEGGMLVLRGTTLDRYAGREWSHARRDDAWDNVNVTGSASLPSPLPPFLFNHPPVWNEQITLESTGSPVLFSMAGPVEISSGHDLKLKYNTGDQTLALTESPGIPELTYLIGATNNLEHKPPPAPPPPLAQWERTVAHIRDIHDIASRPEVCGQSGGKSLAELRESDAHKPNAQGLSDLDAQIAANIEKYLRTNFTYTLNLSADRDLLRADDPMWVFLTKVKKGHCEYFAGAMTLLCQSLGMQARIVTGFKSEDYNTTGEYFVVLESHAHAWVEVLTPLNGWMSFDPTSSNTSDVQAGSLLHSLKNLFDYLEYTWGTSVVAYDTGRRDNLISRMEGTLTTTAMQSTAAISHWHFPMPPLRRWLQKFGISVYLSDLGTALILIGAISVVRSRIERWRIRRRAARIGLDALSKSDQLRLARQLGFYVEMMRVLERQGIRRSRSQTPMEFSQSLAFLPGDAYDRVLRLTRVFYRVRFGSAQLGLIQQRRLAKVVSQLANLPGMHS